MTFAEKIKTARKNCGLTQAELAEAVGISDRAALAYEAEGIIARKKVIRKLARVLNVSYDYLFRDDIQDPDYHKETMDSVDRVVEALGDSAGEEYSFYVDQNMILFAGGQLPKEVTEQYYNALANAYILAENRRKRKKSEDGQ